MFSRGSTHNISLVEAQGEGKKQALRQGIQVAKGEWIVATDGDCSMGPQWLAHLVNYIQLNQVKLLIGPVVYFQEKSFISKLFSLDFMSLVASGAAAVGAGFPFMGNGANIAFSKDAYLEVKDRLGDETYASGDDVFLIHGVVSAYGRKSVHFIKNPQSIVSTAAPASISAFFQQRLRWGSKAKGYKLPWAMGLSMVVFLYSLMLTSLLCASIVFPWVGLVYVLFCLLKFLADVVLLHAFSEFASRRKLMKYVLPFELIYPIYIVITAFSGLFFSYTWKGRAGRT